MPLPFTSEQFFAVFSDYNEAVWPVQIVLFLLAASAVFLVFLRKDWADHTISLILALLWGCWGVAVLAFRGLTNARLRTMLRLVLGETLEQKRFFDQALAGRTDLLGRRADGAGTKGAVLPTRWVN